MNFEATFLLQLSSSWHLISIQLCLYNAFKCNIFRRQLSYSFIMSLVLTWFSGRCEKFRKPKLAIHFGKRLFFKRVKKGLWNWWSPSKFGRNVARTKWYKIMSAFFFPFSIALFLFFVFVLFSVFDHLFIKCKYFSIGSGGAQVYFKKIDLISRKCWQLFEDWIFVTETVQLLFTRGHVWYPILSTEKCPSVFFLLWIQDFSKENWWKSEAKVGLEPPTLFLNPYAYGTQGYKGCYFFLACFSQFFSVVVFLFVHRDAKDGFLFFLFFLSLFLLIFFLHAFCSKLD